MRAMPLTAHAKTVSLHTVSYNVEDVEKEYLGGVSKSKRGCLVTGEKPSGD